MICLLVLANILSAVGVVYSSFLARQLFNENQQAYRLSVQLEEQWGRLLLEKSTWAAPQRIEQKAVGQLQMKVPKTKEIVMVPE